MDTPPSPSLLQASALVPIAQLSPSLESPSHVHIRAVVTLLWPYSSSHQTFTLLLAESDFRLRRSKGQVRVGFYGASAKAVANTRVGIGDTVLLSLKDAKWERVREGAEGEIATPGKGVDWNLRYEAGVILEVQRDAQRFSSVNLEATHADAEVESSPPPILQNGNLDGHTRGSLASVDLDFPVLYSPAFYREKRISSGASFFDASLDPFADDDGYILGKGRKRTKFARDSGSWRYSERTSSPEKDGMAEITQEDFELLENGAILPAPGSEATPPDSVAENVSYSPADRIEPPPQLKAQVQMQELGEHMPASNPEVATSFVPHDPETGLTGQIQAVNEMDIPQIIPTRGESQERQRSSTPGLEQFSAVFQEGEPADATSVSDGNRSRKESALTPRLRPLASPGLPLVSPTFQKLGVGFEFFPGPAAQNAELEANRRLIKEPVVEALNSGGVAAQSAFKTPATQPAPITGIQYEDKPEFQPEALDNSHYENQDASSHEFHDGSPLVYQETFVEARTSPVDKLKHGLVYEEARLSQHRQDEHMDDASSQEVQPGPGAEPQAPSSPQLEAPKKPVVIELEDSSESSFEAEISSEEDLAQGTDQLGRPMFPEVHFRRSTSPKLISSPGALPAEDAEEMESESSSDQGLDEVENDVVEISGAEESEDSELVKASAVEEMYESGGEDADDEGTPEENILDRSDLVQGSIDGPSGMKDIAKQSLAIEVIDEEQIQEEQQELSAGLQEKIIEASPSVSEAIEKEMEAKVPSPTHRHEGSDVEVAEAEKDVVEAEDAGKADDVEIIEIRTPQPPQAISAMDNEDKEDTGDESDEKGEAEDALEEPWRSSPSLSSPSIIRTPTAAGRTNTAKSPIVPLRWHFDGPASAEGIGQRNIQLSVNTEEPLQTEESRREEIPESPEPTVTEDGQESPTSPSRQLRSTTRRAAQLVTPNNTQQTKSFRAETSVLSISDAPVMLTPRDTQSFSETVLAPADEAKTETMEGYPDVSVSRRSPRLSRSRLSGNFENVVSPWFTPRTASQPAALQEKEEKDEFLKVDKKLAPGQPSAHMDESKLPSKLQSGTNGKVEAPDEAKEHQTPARSLRPRPAKPSPPDATTEGAAGLRTRHSYFPFLSSLSSHFSSLVDTVSIVVSSTSTDRSKSGPKDFFVTLHLTDQSLESSFAVCQVFRPYKTALPEAKRGDVVLLRNFKVQTRKRQPMLLSTETSAWAVFLYNHDSGKAKREDAKMDGPPVEYGSEEKAYVRSLAWWWAEDGHMRFTSNDDKPEDKGPGVKTRSARKAESTPPPSDARSARQSSVIHELRDGVRYTDEPGSSGRRRSRAENIHELRDGQRYTDG